MKDINIGETRGIERKIDELGRVVLPKEFRKSLNFGETQSVEIFLTKTGIFLRKV